MKRTPSRGYLMILGLVFGAVFLTVFGGLSMFVLSENRFQTHNEESTEAFALAEAGLEYYRWFLAHYPTDLQNGTGVPGPYVLSYNDPEADVVGTATLDIQGNTACGQTISIDIASTGVPSDATSVSRTIHARYAQPSVGTYSYVLNDSVWAGGDRVILGPYHSNGGVRMDGTSNSPVTSSLETWYCGSSYGCGDGQDSGEIGNPSAGTKAGVFGGGPNQNLWEWPVPQVNFAGISADFGTLKTLAQTEGVYYPRYSTTNGQGQPAYWRGYHIIFNADNTMTVRHVSATTQLSVTHVNPYDTAGYDRALIQNEAAYETVAIPADCGLIFVEDNVWVEGTIPQKITLVAANVANANIAPTAYLSDNIVYETQDGTDGFTLIAEHNVLIAPDVPQNLTLNGIFIAQGGAFGMNGYGCNSGYATKGALTMLGTTVSNRRTGTKWSTVCSNGSHKGFQTRVDSYDRRIAFDPPPFTPVISTDYQFVDWREE